MSLSSSRRAAALAAAVAAPLLATALGQPASGTAAEASAPVRNSNGWVALSSSVATNLVDPNVLPGMAQLADGSLVVAWRQNNPEGGDPQLVTARIGSDNTVETPAARLTWPNLGLGTKVLARPGGADVFFVGGDGTAGYFGGGAYRLQVDGTGAVTGPAEERFLVQPVGYDFTLDAARTADGTPVVSQARRWHAGPVGPSETEDPTYRPEAPGMTWSSLAAAGSTAYLAYFTTGVPDLVARGIYVGPVDAAEDQPAVKLPGSWYADQPVAVEGSTTGVLWAAYCLGTDACDRLVLRDITHGRSITVPTGEYAARIALAPGPSGRMVVAWQSGSSAVSVARTNKAGTRFGTVRRSAPFSTVNSVQSVVVEGRTGPSDVLVNGRREIWHRRFLAPVTATASPARWRIGRKQAVVFTVKDAGDALSGAEVVLGSRSCTTGSTGRCTITVPARSRPATLTARVSRATYETRSVTLKVVR